MSIRKSIKNWAEEERPREKLIAKGEKSLTAAELLAILIGSGNKRKSALDVAREILDDCDNKVENLYRLTYSDLLKYEAIGEAKAVTILAACELGKRRQLEKAQERQRIDSATAIYEHMHPLMQDLNTEEAWILLMNQDYKLIKTVRISRGGISETAVDVRIILKEALLCNATVLALCHNHPSNSIRPSNDDNRLTERVKKACETMRIYLLDHVIITDGAYYSYQEQGRI